MFTRRGRRRSRHYHRLIVTEQLIDQDQYDNDLSGQLNNLLEADDVNDTVKNFDDAVLAVLDKHEQHVDRLITTRHRPEWYNSEIDEARRDRMRHERRWRKLKRWTPNLVSHVTSDAG